MVLLSHGLREVPIVNTADPWAFVDCKASGKVCACAAASVAALRFRAIKLPGAPIYCEDNAYTYCKVGQLFKGFQGSDNLEISDCVKVGFQTAIYQVELSP